MFHLRYTCKDLVINVTGDTPEQAKEKALVELAWWREKFPRSGYPKTMRKFAIRPL